MAIKEDWMEIGRQAIKAWSDSCYEYLGDVLGLKHGERHFLIISAWDNISREPTLLTVYDDKCFTSIMDMEDIGERDGIV